MKPPFIQLPTELREKSQNFATLVTDEDVCHESQKIVL
jgi:hypothetical protein